MINILHLTTDSRIAGAEKLLLGIAKNCDKTKFKLYFCTLKEEGDLHKELAKFGQSALSLNCSNYLKLPVAAIKLLILLRKYKIDILHTHLFHASILGQVVLKFQFRAVGIMTRHYSDWLYLYGNRWQRFFDKFSSNLSSYIIAISNGVKKVLVELDKIKQGKITVVYNGVDISEFNSDLKIGKKVRDSLGINASDKVIGVIGSLHPRKGHIYFIEAANMLCKKRNDLKFLVVGDGILRSQLINLRDSLGLKDRIIFTGYQKDVVNMVSAIDIVVQPSIEEGFGISIIEAMALNKPVIGTKVGGIPEIIEDGRTGLLVPSRDPVKLSEAIDLLLNDMQRMISIGEEARKVVTSKFDLLNMIKSYEKHYFEIMEEQLTRKQFYSPSFAITNLIEYGLFYPLYLLSRVFLFLGNITKLLDQVYFKITGKYAISHSKKTSLKIIHLITDINTGGTELMLCKLISNMNCPFSNVVVSMTDKGTLGSRIESLGLRLYTLNTRKGIPTIFAFVRLLRILRHEKPDILQTWLYHADLLGLFAGKLAGIPIIYWNIRCSYVDIKNYQLFKKILLNLLIKLSIFPNSILVNSNSGMLIHKRLGYKPQRWDIIHNGFDTSLFYPRFEERQSIKKLFFKEEKNVILIGLVARFDPMKDHENFLHAIKVFISKFHSISNIRFVFIGSGMDNNLFLLQLINKLQINDWIKFLGEHMDIHDIMPGFDIYCSSSYSEGFPNTIGEAMACGLPCVATDVGDSAFLIGDCGIVVPPKSPESLALGWYKFISMTEEERRNVGLLARKRIVKLFTIQGIAREYENIYKRG